MNVANTPPTKALAKAPSKLLMTLQSEDFMERMSKIIPDVVTKERFVALCIATSNRCPELSECNPGSVVEKFMTLGQLGLEIGPMAHLWAVRNRRADAKYPYEPLLVIDYKGYVDVIMRTKQVSFVHADVVCENDEFEYNLGQIICHRINFKKERGKPYAVYSFARMKDGSMKCDAMSIAEVEKIRSRSPAGNSGPWVSDWNEMAKKTVIRRMRKQMQMSPEHHGLLDEHDEPTRTEVVVAKPLRAKEIAATTGASEPEDDVPFESLEPQTQPPSDPPTKPEPKRAARSPQQPPPTITVSSETVTKPAAQPPEPPIVTVVVEPEKPVSRKDKLIAALNARGVTKDMFVRWAIACNQDNAVCEIQTFDDIPTEFAEKWGERPKTIIENMINLSK